MLEMEDKLMAEAERLMREVALRKAEFDRLRDFLVANKSTLDSVKKESLRVELLSREAAYMVSLLACGKVLNKVAGIDAEAKERRLAEAQKEHADLQASLDFQKGITQSLKEENAMLKRLKKHNQNIDTQ